MRADLARREPEWLARWESERQYERIIQYYGRTLKWVLKHQFATLMVAVATLVLTIILYVIVPKGVEDLVHDLGFARVESLERQLAITRTNSKDWKGTPTAA